MKSEPRTMGIGISRRSADFHFIPDETIIHTTQKELDSDYGYPADRLP